MNEKDYIAALKAGMAYSGVTRKELAEALDIHYDTLGRKLRGQEPLTLLEMIEADKIVKWTQHLGGAR